MLLTSYKLALLLVWTWVFLYLIRPVTCSDTRGSWFRTYVIDKKYLLNYRSKLIAPTGSCSFFCPDNADHQVRRAPLMIWCKLDECCVRYSSKYYLHSSLFVTCYIQHSSLTCDVPSACVFSITYHLNTSTCADRYFIHVCGHVLHVFLLMTYYVVHVRLILSYITKKHKQTPKWFYFYVRGGSLLCCRAPHFIVHGCIGFPFLWLHLQETSHQVSFYYNIARMSTDYLKNFLRAWLL